MSFNPLNFSLNRALPGQLSTITMPAIHWYRSDVDNITTIMTSGYFNALIPQQFLPLPAHVSGGINNNFIEQGDYILVVDSTGTGALIQITAVTPNVTTATQTFVIPPGSITGADIAAGTITGANIAANTITGSNIAPATITGAKIQNGTISGALIASNTIAGSNIQLSTIAHGNMAPNSVDMTNIIPNTLDGTIFTSGFFQTGTNTVTFSGPWAASHTVNIWWQLMGSAITLEIDGLSATTTTSTFATGTAIPNILWPVHSNLATIAVLDSSGSALGVCSLNTSGVMTIGLGASGSGFTNPGTSGWQRFTLQYTKL